MDMTHLLLLAAIIISVITFFVQTKMILFLRQKNAAIIELAESQERFSAQLVMHISAVENFLNMQELEEDPVPRIAKMLVLTNPDLAEHMKKMSES